MRKVLEKTALFILSCVINIPAEAQTSSSYDLMLSLLRGTWEHAKFNEKITIEFLSDTEVYLRDSLYTYSISDGAFLLEIRREEHAYTYSLEGNILTVTDPDGKSVPYKRADFGYYEKLLDGSFYTIEDTDDESSIIFKNFREFQLNASGNTNPDTDLRPLKGYYRVEGNDIYLTLIDETVEIARIRYRDENDTIIGITYKHQQYEKELPITYTDPGPEPPPPPPPPPPQPDPPLPPYITPDPKPVSPVRNGTRDDGPKRDVPKENRPGKKRP